jgi:hypothetical protein
MALANNALTRGRNVRGRLFSASLILGKRGVLSSGRRRRFFFFLLLWDILPDYQRDPSLSQFDCCSVTDSDGAASDIRQHGRVSWRMIAI